MCDAEALQASRSASAGPLRGKILCKLHFNKIIKSKVACVFYIDNNL